MALNKAIKQEIIKQFAREKNDTGSPEVQVGLLARKVLDVTSHLERHPKDRHSRRGLIKMVAKRRRLFDYLKVKSKSRFQALQKVLSL